MPCIYLAANFMWRTKDKFSKHFHRLAYYNIWVCIYQDKQGKVDDCDEHRVFRVENVIEKMAPLNVFFRDPQLHF